ncbi:MAG: acetyl-CoA C-acetyltransferase [Gammaproteobacteria bacterium]|nr:acetyl-CoA C-acetyltransferase [Gammaproteobacteria bacterium]
MSNQKPVYIVDMSRTPFIKAEQGPGAFSASDLAVAACRPMLLRQSFLPTELGEVITGCMMPSSEEANISRVISLRIGCGKEVPAYTVQRNCASGMQAIDCAMKDIQLERHDLALAGGVDAMSRAPLLFNSGMTAWFSRFASSKNVSQKIKTLLQFRPQFLAPEIALLKGLTDHTVRMSMGQTAEEVAYRYQISREAMDAYALQSHMRAMQAQKDKSLTNIVPLINPRNGNVIAIDNGVRADSSLERLAKLKPFFDKPFGAVTAGNSSQITDGAAYMLLASEAAVKRLNLPVRAKIVDVAWVGLAPEVMGLGPAVAIQKLMQQQNFELNSIDYWEMNEAFAAQVLGCLSMLRQEGRVPLAPTQNKSIPQDKLNIYGGAIALGHPVGASGARIVMQLINALENNNAKRGVATLCIGGGQGGAMLIERVSGETK